MRVSNRLIKSFPYLLGTWILRSTNDKYLSDGFTYLVLHNDDTLKLKTIYQEGIIGVKKSRYGNIDNIRINNSAILLDITYNAYIKYSQSILGIQIPEFKSDELNYTMKKELSINIIDKTLLIKDLYLPLYYLFDLQIGKIKSPLIETGMNTLIFTQVVSFFLNLLMANLIHLLIKDLYF
jgi:hypothetical protein